MNYKAYTDEALLRLIKEHDDHLAYSMIFERYNALIYSHVYNKLRNEFEAEDTVQEIFSQFWIKRNEIDLTYKFPGFLFLLARNKVIDHVRKKKLSNITEEFYSSNLYTKTYSTDFLIREKQLEALIAHEISLLPPKMRQAFELRYKNYLSIRQISEEMGISEATAATHMKKALKTLRLKLKIAIFIVFLANILGSN
ncbi:RNA polymerase sigma factor [Pinibacter aurantiacus]|uniref:Sigma-70 family RNA polymerase sigma factor n=1 Tax=Pinibacter aurantiacus TaxID=2851599 RepID=A0A9E2S7H3_9BACT|nr:sigma-70 family RNA polymerase sigma factor [Pinibacter aurantiacus]MBV4357281.1 sigma-70 family RNA polymerase sigma factor [Pinibacter aurantiacus]